MTLATRSRATDALARAAWAERSAGRTGGYCWMEPEDGGSHCTLHPLHKGRHFDFYTRREFD